MRGAAGLEAERFVEPPAQAQADGRYDQKRADLVAVQPRFAWDS
jgi:hypothetical protein